MDDVDKYRYVNRARLDDRLVSELIGVCHGALADGKVTVAEAEYIQKWLVANNLVTSNPVIKILMDKLEPILGVGDVDRSSGELFAVLSQFLGGEFELGEMAKATSLPIDIPAPEIEVIGSRFCFTGTFAYGKRSACEAAVCDRGGVAGSLTRKTKYLVVGAYATSSWIHSAYGRKIENALALKEQGIELSIVGEDHWLTFL